MGITDPTEQYFKDGGWHWTGSEWIGGGLAFEYAGQLLGQVYVASALAPWQYVFSDAVPPGEAWIATAMAIENVTSITSGRFLGVQQGGNEYWLGIDAGGVAGTAYAWSGFLVLVEGAKLAGGINGCTVDDGVYFWYAGYKMRLT